MTQNSGQPFINPAALLAGQGPCKWTVVRTRPRWEKKFARWLHGVNMSYFLPVIHKTTVSHRKKRITEQPLFPGYAFVSGFHEKKAFVNSHSVVYVLYPDSEQENSELDAELRSLWILLNSDEPLIRESEFQPGQRVEVTEGPFRGAIGIYVERKSSSRLLVWLDILGAGVSLEIEDPWILRAVD